MGSATVTDSSCVVEEFKFRFKDCGCAVITGASLAAGGVHVTVTLSEIGPDGPTQVTMYVTLVGVVTTGCPVPWLPLIGSSSSALLQSSHRVKLQPFPDEVV